MKRALSACICLAAVTVARADVIELQNGAKSEGRVLSLFNQRLEVAGSDGSVTHVKLQDVQRVSFDSQIALVTLRDHTTLNGELLGLEDGVLTVGVANGAPRHVALVAVTDLTVSGKSANAPSQPPPPHIAPQPLPMDAAPSRPLARGSIQPEYGKINIVDFYADWCGPCRKISPVLEKIAKANPDITLQKINIDKNHDLAEEYKVTSIPHIIIYDKRGGVVDTVIGADEAHVRKALEAAASDQ